MNGFDLALLILASLLVVVGLIKGLVRILIGIAALIAAFALAAIYHEPVAAFLRPLDAPEEVARLLAYLLIFVGVLLAGGILAYLTRKLMKVAMLGWADRLAGAALGLTAAMLTAALVILPIVAYSPRSERILARSLFAPYVAAVADLANHLVPEDLSRGYRRGVEDLRRYWREQMFEREEPGPLEI